MTLDALPDQTFEGEVTDIANEGMANNGVSAFDVTIHLSKSEGIRAGMTAQASIDIEKKSDILLVPIEAVQDNDGKKFVILKSNQETTSQRQTITREIKTGIHNEDFIEITDGLKAGDLVVLPSIVQNTENGFGFFGGGNKKRSTVKNSSGKNTKKGGGSNE